MPTLENLIASFGHRHQLIAMPKYEQYASENDKLLPDADQFLEGVG
jgi:hypothetical protein